MFVIMLDYVLDINECMSSPCQNKAVCINLPDSYLCICTAGYKGPNCETGTLADYARVMCLISYYLYL